MSNIRFGLIGFGRWGRHHARAIRDCPGAELAAVCARTAESRDAAAAEFSVPAFTDLHAMLEEVPFDVAAVVVPNHLHREAAVAALEAGRHVLLEKPMALTVAECDEIIAAAGRAGRELRIAFEKRVSPLWLAVHEQIRTGAVGSPVAVWLELVRMPYRSGVDGWRHDPERIGNWILEEPVHFLDLACWYMGADPLRLYARASTVAERPPRLYDNMSYLLEFPSGYAAVNQTLAASGHHVRVKVIGTEAVLLVHWDGEVDESRAPDFGIVRVAGGREETVPVRGMAGEYYEIDMEIADMVRAIRDGESRHLATSGEGRRAVMLCEAGVTSVEENRIVEVS